jgi:hypothetical protein
VEQQAGAESSDQIQTLLQSFDPPALLDDERALFADLEARKLDSKSDTSKVLVRHFAKMRILWRCEVVYRLIFGSQLRFLKTLNVSGAMSEENAHQYYVTATQSYREVFPEKDSKPYFTFLIRQGLVIVQNDSFFVSNFGREFLSWLIQMGVSEDKPL